MKQNAELHTQQQEAVAAPEPLKANPLMTAYEWVETLIWCFLFVVILFTFVVRVVGVSGPSMQDTLHDGERLVTINYFTPKYGDIVAITQPKELEVPLVKRVIATEGQVVDINFETGEVYVDGKLLTEPYIKTPTTVSGDVEFPVTVPKGRVFVLGDNREVSLDSRYSEVGMIDVRYIFGKVVFRLLPMNKAGVPK